MLINFSRLFSCGTGKDGEPYLVEWDESEGYIKRTYKGLKKPCFSAINFKVGPLPEYVVLQWVLVIIISMT